MWIQHTIYLYSVVVGWSWTQAFCSRFCLATLGIKMKARIISYIIQCHDINWEDRTHFVNASSRFRVPNTCKENKQWCSRSQTMPGHHMCNFTLGGGAFPVNFGILEPLNYFYRSFVIPLPSLFKSEVVLTHDFSRYMCALYRYCTITPNSWKWD